MSIRMKVQQWLVLAAAALVIVGCGGDRAHQHSHDDGHDHEHPGEQKQFVTFEENKGLLVSTQTARWLDLQTAEVETRAISTESRFTARVYRQADTRGPTQISAAASAWLNPGDARRLRIGQPVRVIEPASNTSWEGRIAGLDSFTTNASGGVELRIEFNDPSAHLLPGAPVMVSAPASRTGAIVTPASALVENVDGWFVYAVHGKHFKRRLVTVGGRQDGDAQITEGLEAGDRVVVRGATALWLTELKFTKAGAACCPAEKK